MEQDKLSNDMDVIVVIDKEKLPEDIRKILEEKLPKDIQEKVLKMLNPYNSNKLFAIETGTVIGNIYDKNFKLVDMTDKGD